MRFAGRSDLDWKGSLRGSVRAVLAGALCVLIVEQPLLAGATVVKRGPTAGGAQIQGDARVLHALNRLTFGPRPGDVAAVKAMGLTAWFEMQLNPEKINDSALDARLANYPAMQLTQPELIAKYPSQQIIREMVRTNQWLPADPVEHAIYADQMAFYRIQKEKQEATPLPPAIAATGGDGMAGDGMQPAMAGASGQQAMAGKKKAAQSGDMAGGAMAGPAAAGGTLASDGTMVGDGTKPVPKSEMAEGPAPAEHVENLFKDLEAVSIINLSPDERMRKVLALRAADFVSFRQSLSAAELAQFVVGLSPQQREIFAAMQQSTRMVGSEELQVRLMRDIYSERQLQAVMTDFWLNHFSVYVRKNQNEPYLIPAYEREVIRPNALGKFEDLLVATAKSPAMLMYLDNWESIGPESKAAKMGKGLAGLANPQVRAQLKDRGLNENYGRELMELHTLGVNGGYTQADVTQVAKVFTGWTISLPKDGGQFQFEDRRHEPGPKTVLGKTINENGENEGLQVLHMLATSPATAKFISTKLAVRFVSDDPSPVLVDRMTRSFLDSDGDIKTVLRTMFNSPEFWAPSVEKAKVKTPLEFVVSAVRASGATVNNALGLVQALDRLGMPLYGMQTPNGYSWMSEPWVSTGALVSRMNFALVMTGDKLPGTRTDWAKVLGSAGMVAKPVGMSAGGSGSADADPEVVAKEAKLEQVLLGQAVSERTRATVIGQSGDSTAALQAAKEFQGGGGGRGGAAGLVGGDYNPVISGPMRPGGGQRNGVVEDRQAAVMAGLLLGSPEFQRR